VKAHFKKLSPTFKKLLDAAREMGLRFGHIAARPGPLEVPMIPTPTPDRRMQTALNGILRRMRPNLCLLTLLIFLPSIALAQSPFDTGFTALQTLFTGTVAKVASLIAIVVGGYQFAHGEPGAKKTLAGVAAGTGIAVLAANVLTWLWGV
jgi:type IV secretion system protein VirB2